VVIDATGHPAAITDALAAVARRGRYLQFGVASPAATVTLSPYDVFDREIRVIGSKSYLHSFERSIDLLARGVIDVPALVTHRLPLASYGEAVDLLRAGGGRKIQVVP
jgi:threonine dehydrogenase-like Zn-dependent dehydrogenase